MRPPGDDRIRIAVVADDLYPGFGGQAAATEGHVEALLGLGHEVRALAGAEESPTSPPGVEVRRLRAWRPGRKQTRVAVPNRREARALLEWADVVQINTPTPLALMTLRLAATAGVPSVMGFHTQEESAAPHFGPLSPLAGAGLRAWYGYLYRLPDCLVAPTDFAARLARRYTTRPVHVVSNGIRLPEERPGGERVASLRRRLLSGKSFLISHVGRLSHEKNPQDLLAVMSALARARQDALLAVAGSGPLRSSLERRAARLGIAGCVRFLGYVSEEEKDQLLRASDLFLMPSPTELQSIATLEAMARGCAVVAADVATSAVGEVVSGADCGLLYDPAHPEEAALRIRGLLERPEELWRLRENAARAAVAHDVRESGRRLQEIYRRLLEVRSERLPGSEKPLERTNR